MKISKDFSSIKFLFKLWKSNIKIGKMMQYHNNVDKTFGRDLYDYFVSQIQQACNQNIKWSSSGCQIKFGTYGIRQVYSTQTNGPYLHIVDCWSCFMMQIIKKIQQKLDQNLILDFLTNKIFDLEVRFWFGFTKTNNKKLVSSESPFFD